MKYLNSIILCIAIATIGQLDCSDEKNTNPQQPTPESTQPTEKSSTNNIHATKAAPSGAQATQWSTAAKVGAGLAGAAVVAGAVHLYNPTAFSNLAQQTTDLVNWLGGGTSQAEQARIAAEKDAAHIAELARIEQARLALEAKLAAEKRARLEAEQRNNLFMGAGLAAGAAGVIGLGIINNNAEQKSAQLKKDNKDKLTPKSTKDFEYLNYLDTDDTENKEFSNAGRKIVKAQEDIDAAERKDKAKKRKDLQTDAEKAASIPEIETHEVQFKPNEFDKNNYPTGLAIKNLMHKEYFSKLATSELQVTTVFGGTMSDKIYCVSVKNNPIFFLKISKSIRGTTANNLKNLQQSRIGRIGVEARYADTKLKIARKNLPILTWIEDFFTYTNPTGEQRTIEVSHAAHGQSIAWILKNADEQSQLICMKAVGKALGSFQQAFMIYHNSDDAAQWTTASHRDLNSENVFFDAITSQVYFIDNETIQDNASIATDPCVFLYIALASVSNKSFQINNMIAFIQAYIESFPPTRQKAIEKIIIQFTPAWWNEADNRFSLNIKSTIAIPFIKALNEKVLKHIIIHIDNNTKNLTPIDKIISQPDGTRIESVMNTDGNITQTTFGTNNKKTKVAIAKDLRIINAKFFYPDTEHLKLNAIVDPDGAEHHTNYAADGTTIFNFIDFDNKTPQTQIFYQSNLDGSKGPKIKEVMIYADKSLIIKNFDHNTGQLIQTIKVNPQGYIIS